MDKVTRWTVRMKWALVISEFNADFSRTELLWSHFSSHLLSHSFFQEKNLLANFIVLSIIRDGNRFVGICCLIFRGPDCFNRSEELAPSIKRFSCSTFKTHSEVYQKCDVGSLRLSPQMFKLCWKREFRHPQAVQLHHQPQSRQ